MLNTKAMEQQDRPEALTKSPHMWGKNQKEFFGVVGPWVTFDSFLYNEIYYSFNP